MVTYKTYAPKGYMGDPTRGAAMGRYSQHGMPEGFAGDLFVEEEVVDEEGYDRLGTYWGYHPKEGPRLFWYANACGCIDAVVDAPGWDEALARIAAKYPEARLAVDRKKMWAAHHAREAVKATFDRMEREYAQEKQRRRHG